MLIIILLAILLFGGFSGYYGHSRWGGSSPIAGPGIGIGTILIILLLCYAFGVFR